MLGFLCSDYVSISASSDSQETLGEAYCNKFDRKRTFTGAKTWLERQLNLSLMSCIY
jgi:hypothetical protein